VPLVNLDMRFGTVSAELQLKCQVRTSMFDVRSYRRCEILSSMRDLHEPLVQPSHQRGLATWEHEF